MTQGERACRVLIILLIAIGTVWGTWQILVPKPSVSLERPVSSDTAIRPPAKTPTGSNAVTEAAEPVEPLEEEPAIGLYDRKENFYTFLLIGMDKGGGNTDSIMLVSYDVDQQSVSVASIARDTRVDVSRSLKKINAAYALNGGVEGLKSEVSKTFGIPIDYYLRVNLRGFTRLVDAVGGIDFNIPCSMNYDDPAQGLSIHYSKGQRHLSGQQALEVCRFRQNNDGSGYGDEGRQSTQRGVLTEVMKKVLANPGKISEYVQIASDNLDTDLKASDMAWFATKAVSFKTENLRAMSMPCAWHSPYMYLNAAETLNLVNEYLNPYVLDRTPDMLDIVTR